jgi:predicted transcriptional regulator
MKVLDIMSKHIVTIKEDVRIADAIELMNKKHIGR